MKLVGILGSERYTEPFSDRCHSKYIPENKKGVLGKRKVAISRDGQEGTILQSLAMTSGQSPIL